MRHSRQGWGRLGRSWPLKKAMFEFKTVAGRDRVLWDQRSSIISHAKNAFLEIKNILIGGQTCSSFEMMGVWLKEVYLFTVHMHSPTVRGGGGSHHGSYQKAVTAQMNFLQEAFNIWDMQYLKFWMLLSLKGYTSCKKVILFGCQPVCIVFFTASSRIWVDNDPVTRYGDKVTPTSSPSNTLLLNQFTRSLSLQKLESSN